MSDSFVSNVSASSPTCLPSVVHILTVQSVYPFQTLQLNATGKGCLAYFFFKYIDLERCSSNVIGGFMLFSVPGLIEQKLVTLLHSLNHKIMSIHLAEKYEKNVLVQVFMHFSTFFTLGKFNLHTFKGNETFLFDLQFINGTKAHLSIRALRVQRNF